MRYRLKSPIAGLSLVLLGLAACQPAPANDDTDTSEATAEDILTEAPETATVAATPDETLDPQADTETQDHDAEDHSEHAEHDDEHEHHDHDHEHEEDAHEDDHAAHSHDEHDHDEHDHEAAGGEAHVHGLADLVVTIEGNTINVGLIAPLANFGLSESNPNVDDYTPYGDAVIDLPADNCAESAREIKAETDGQHGYMSIDLIFDCADVTTVGAADITLFDAYSGFEKIDAVILTETDQKATDLTPSAHTLTLP